MESDRSFATAADEEVDIHAPSFLSDPAGAFAVLRQRRPVARSNKQRMELAAALKGLAQTGTAYRLDPVRPPRWKTRGDRRGLASLPILLGTSA